MAPTIDITNEAPRGEAESRERARADRIAELKRHLTGYLELRPDQSADALRFERAVDLSGEYGEQYRFLGDARLADMEIVIVPDQTWIKGSQPSESSASQGMILIREGYFRDPKKERQDETAWMTHELSHLQQSLDRGPAGYEQAQATPAYADIGVETYPNNQVEEYTFRRQFDYLKAKGLGRERVAALLQDEYSQDDFKFLNRILDRVYGK